jgi:hypothetical protein
LNPITKTNNRKLIHNFGRREEIMEADGNKQRPKRAISEIRAQNGNYIGMKLLGFRIRINFYLGNTTDKDLATPSHVNEEIEKELIVFK